MASNKNALAMCDTCGFVYPHRVMRLNSYGMLVCPQDFDGQFDLKNHPQNKVPDVRDDPVIRILVLILVVDRLLGKLLQIIGMQKIEGGKQYEYINWTTNI